MTPKETKFKCYITKLLSEKEMYSNIMYFLKMPPKNAVPIQQSLWYIAEKPIY